MWFSQSDQVGVLKLGFHVKMTFDFLRSTGGAKVAVGAYLSTSSSPSTLMSQEQHDRELAQLFFGGHTWRVNEAKDKPIGADCAVSWWWLFFSLGENIVCGCVAHLLQSSKPAEQPHKSSSSSSPAASVELMSPSFYWKEQLSCFFLFYHENNVLVQGRQTCPTWNT